MAEFAPVTTLPSAAAALRARPVAAQIIHLGDSEWGNELMQSIAQEAFLADPSVDLVEVIEHGGWWLQYERGGAVVGTANDAAVLPPSTRARIHALQARARVDGLVYLPSIRRP